MSMPDALVGSVFNCEGDSVHAFNRSDVRDVPGYGAKVPRPLRCCAIGCLFPTTKRVNIFYCQRVLAPHHRLHGSMLRTELEDIFPEDILVFWPHKRFKEQPRYCVGTWYNLRHQHSLRWNAIEYGGRNLHAKKFLSVHLLLVRGARPAHCMQSAFLDSDDASIVRVIPYKHHIAFAVRSDFRKVGITGKAFEKLFSADRRGFVYSSSIGRPIWRCRLHVLNCCD